MNLIKPDVATICVGMAASMGAGVCAYFIGATALILAVVFGVLELVFGVTGTQEGVAHFAHLGGVTFVWRWMRSEHASGVVWGLLWLWGHGLL